MMKRSLSPLFLSLLFFAACSSPTSVTRPVPIAGGKIVPIAFGPHGPLPGSGNGYEVRLAVSEPGPREHEILYTFAVAVPPATTLKRVVVDDISEEQSSALVDDTKPWVDGDHWRAQTKPIDYKDPLLAWVYTVMPSIRVYRFTITDSADKKTILYQVTSYQEFIKSKIRATWGEKY